MDFAKKILNKYGWKEGDGLGKHNHGIAKPLKASLKFDTAGFGADQAASDFNNHWWERVFNEAAQNVDIKADENGTIKMKRKHPENEVEISTKSFSVRKLKKAKSSNKSAEAYNNFIPSATLLTSGSEIENAEKISEEDIAVTSFKILSDEELFQACGGRTAHKGARHGLKLTGKLSRVEQQEKELLARMLNRRNINEEMSNSKNINTGTKKKKKQKKEKLELESVIGTNETETENGITEENCIKLKKSKKKHREHKETNEPITQMKKKKKKNNE